MANALQMISQAGVSIWLDDLSRERLVNQSLKRLIDDDCVVGVTTNPSIFLAAISNSDLYHADILANRHLSVDEIITKLTTDDVRAACDLFQPTFQKSNYLDGRVSIEVDPRYARDVKATIEQGRQLWQLIGRENLLIKIPATIEGLLAITTLISEGISVNVTLIFSVERYKQVLLAYQDGLLLRLSKGLDISKIQSVASFFISRIDTAVDLKLPLNSELRGCAAIANACMAYHAFTSYKESDQWCEILSKGGNIQRPLWASTGVKDPAFDPNRYVTELLGPSTVNTMPELTMQSVKKAKTFRADSIIDNFQSSKANLAKIALNGIDLDQITADLEIDGVDKFEKSWLDLINKVKQIVGAL